MVRHRFLLGVGALVGATVVGLSASPDRPPTPARSAEVAGQPAAAPDDSEGLGFVDDEPIEPLVRSVDWIRDPAVKPLRPSMEVPRELRAAGVPVFGPAPVPPPPRPQPITGLSGRNLEGWEVVVGDGIWASSGEAPVGLDDIATDHHSEQRDHSDLSDHSDYSVLRANVHRRAVMAHNITFQRVRDDNALGFRHFGGYRFRLPHPLTTDDREFSAQTIEGGLFVWDGAGERLEHGVGFQWTVNPWSSKFGHVKAWSEDGWRQAGYLKPDLEWHTVTFDLDPASESGVICLDDYCVSDVYTRFPKPDSWGSDVSARLQVEIISLDPGNQPSAPEHRAEVQDWWWEWS